jgi:predicted DNA-binding transcriptional regulator YafY
MAEGDSPSVRLVKLYRCFLNGRAAKTSEVAQRHYGGDKRTALRDLSALSSAGLIRVTGEDTDRTYAITDQSFLDDLRVGDAVSLMLGRRLTDLLGPTGLNGVLGRLPIERAIEPRLRRHLSQKFISVFEPARVYDAAQLKVLDQLAQAIIEERWVDLSYTRSTGEAQALVRFRPLTMAVYRRALYIIGLAGEQRRTLALDRIAGLRVGEVEGYPARWEPLAGAEGAFGIWGDGQPSAVVLRFSAERAHLVRARRWHSSQVLVELPGGGLELRMMAHGTELVRFVCEWGPHCEVLSPAPLRAAVAAQLRAAADLYATAP